MTSPTPRTPVVTDASAFPTLDDSEVASLEPLGSRRTVDVGEYLYREGDLAYDFYVVLSGRVDIVPSADGEERLIASHDRGRFLGELNLLTRQRVFVSARVVEADEVLAVPADALRRVVATQPRLSDKILAALLLRPRRRRRRAGGPRRTPPAAQRRAAVQCANGPGLRPPPRHECRAMDGGR